MKKKVCHIAVADLTKTPYSTANNAVTASEKVNAVIGSKATLSVANKYANAYIFAGKVAERIKVGFAIGSLLNLHQSLEESGYGAFRLSCHFSVFPSRDGGNCPTGRHAVRTARLRKFFSYQLIAVGCMGISIIDISLFEPRSPPYISSQTDQNQNHKRER